MASLVDPEPAYEDLLVDGICAFLAERGVANWDGGAAQTDPYEADGSTEWPLYPGPVMPISPDALIMVTPVSPTYDRADVMTQIQFWIRGPRADENLDERAASSIVRAKRQQIHDLLYPHGRPLVHTTFGTVRIGGVFPSNGALQPPDTSRRYAHISNYRFRGRRV